MAFVRRKVKTFKWPVDVKEPADGGGFDTSKFTVTFKRISRSALQDLGDKPVTELLKAVVIGWDDLQDEAGKAIPFNAENLADMLDDGDWVRGVMAAFDSTYEAPRQGN